jgi:hypothetical protein
VSAEKRAPRNGKKVKIQLTHSEPFKHLVKDDYDKEDGELFARDGEGDDD